MNSLFYTQTIILILLCHFPQREGIPATRRNFDFGDTFGDKLSLQGNVSTSMKRYKIKCVQTNTELHETRPDPKRVAPEQIPRRNTSSAVTLQQLTFPAVSHFTLRVSPVKTHHYDQRLIRAEHTDAGVIQLDETLQPECNLEPDQLGSRARSWFARK